MSPRAYIVTREGKTGRRWVVRYKPRGASTPVHWGSFTSRKLADRARDYVNGELAVGRYPDHTAMAAPPERVTVLQAYDRWNDSWPPGTGQATLNLHRKARAAFAAHRIATLGVDLVTIQDVQDLVSDLAERYKPATVRRYLYPLRAAVDHAGVEPNPFKDRRLNLPLPDDEDHVDPPSWEAFRAIMLALPKRHRVACLFAERHGLRMVELQKLLVGDLDLAGRRLRIASARTKGRTGGRRWVPLVGLWPEYLHEHHLPPLEDRDHTLPAFPGFNHNTFRGALARACQTAGVGNYPPHQLRHRYITLMLRAGVDPSIVSKIAGHRKQSITLDVYGHVLLDEPQARLDELRLGASWVSGLTPSVPLTPNSPAPCDFVAVMGSTGIEQVTP